MESVEVGAAKSKNVTNERATNGYPEILGCA